MDHNNKGKSEMKKECDDVDESGIDLELKLGQSVSNTQDEENERDMNKRARGFDHMDEQPSHVMVHEFMNPAPAAAPAPWNEHCEVGVSTNLVLRPASAPHQNMVAPNRKRRHPVDGRVCRSCGKTSTPLWRKGPDGPQTLCNGCGLRHLRNLKKGS